MKILTPSGFNKIGATAHTAHNSRAISHEMFYGLMSLTRRLTYEKTYGVARPSRVPVTFSCGCTSKLKCLNVDELEEAVRRDIVGIPQDTVVRLVRNIR